MGQRDVDLLGNELGDVHLGEFSDSILIRNSITVGNIAFRISFKSPQQVAETTYNIDVTCISIQRNRVANCTQLLNYKV